MSYYKKNIQRKDLSRTKSLTVFSQNKFELKDQYPTIPTERSRQNNIQRFDSSKDLSNFEQTKTIQKTSSSTKLPSLDVEVDFDTALMERTGQALGKLANVKSYSILPPITQSGITQVNRMRSQDNIFKNNDQVVDKKTDIYAQQAAIRTGAEAITFFSRNGLRNPIKFVICEKKYDERLDMRHFENRPQDLIVPAESLSEKQVPIGDYFVVNMNGIVAQKKDWEQERYQTEFLTLAEWMNQSTAFDQLSDMNFFRNFIRRKILIAMHNKVRRRMFFLKRRRLLANLQMLKPCQAGVLMDVKKEIANFEFEQVQNVQPDKDSGDNKFEVEDFFNKVDANLDKVNQSYDHPFLPDLRSRLVELCKAVKRKLQRNSESESDKDSKVKPLIHINQDRHLRQLIKNCATLDDSMLLGFLTLVQQMLRGMIFINYKEMQLKFVYEFVSQAEGSLKSVDADERYFKVNLKQVNKAGVNQVLEPDQDKFLNSINGRIDSQLMSLNKFRVLLDESLRSDFNPYVNFSRYSVENLKKLRDIFHSDQLFKKRNLDLDESFKVNWNQCMQVLDKEEQQVTFRIWEEMHAFRPQTLKITEATKIAIEQEGEEIRDEQYKAVARIEEKRLQLEEYTMEEKITMGILIFTLKGQNNNVNIMLSDSKQALQDLMEEDQKHLKDYLEHKTNDERRKQFNQKLIDAAEDQPEDPDEWTSESGRLRKWFDDMWEVDQQQKQMLNFLQEVKKVVKIEATIDGQLTFLKKKLEVVEETLKSRVSLIDSLIDAKVTRFQEGQGGNKDEPVLKDYLDQLKQDHEDYHNFDFEKNIKFYTEQRDKVVEFKNYMYMYKSILYNGNTSFQTHKAQMDYKESLITDNPIVALKQLKIDWKPMNEYIEKLELMLKFYEEMREFERLKSLYFIEMPMARFSEIETQNQVENKAFTYSQFRVDISHLRKRVDTMMVHFKNNWRLETFFKFEERLYRLERKQIPILEKIHLVEMRKEHFLNVFAVCDYKPNKDEIFFQDFVDCGVEQHADKVFEIQQLALDQMNLRILTQKQTIRFQSVEIKAVNERFENLETDSASFAEDYKYVDEILPQNPQYEIVLDEVSELRRRISDFIDLAKRIVVLQKEFEENKRLLSLGREIHNYQSQDQKFREIERLFKKVYKEAEEHPKQISFMPRLDKSDQVGKPTQFQLLKDQVPVLQENNEKISNFIQEQRLTRINNKLLQYKLETIAVYDIPKVIQKIAHESEREIDDLDVSEADAFSESDDNLFQQKLSTLDFLCEDFGVYNKLIKVWYYNNINPALIPPEGKIKRKDQGLREYQDVWQLGILQVDMFTKNTLYEWWKTTEEESNLVECQIKLAESANPIKTIIEIFEAIEAKSEETVFIPLIERVKELKGQISENHVDTKDINEFIQQTVHREKYERYSFNQIHENTYMKKIDLNEEEEEGKADEQVDN